MIMCACHMEVELRILLFESCCLRANTICLGVNTIRLTVCLGALLAIDGALLVLGYIKCSLDLTSGDR